jgi:hypothetical protein
MPGCDERKHVYVTVDDVRECGAMGEVQVAARRKMVSTDQSLIMMDADETDACRKLRDLHLMDGVMTSRVVFKDIFGCRFNWIKKASNGKAAHFARWKGEGEVEHTSSPAVSRAHEEAVENAARLIMANRLNVVQLCDHSSHETRSFPPAISWASAYERCVKAFPVSGVGNGITTQAGYRWYPDADHSGPYFVIDYAVLKGGMLHVAVEVQRSHANSNSKREAFEKHGIRNVQIEANQINEECRGRNWALEHDKYVVVAHHPESTTRTWKCSHCLAKIEREAEETRMRVEREVELKRRRDAYEQPYLTEYTNPQSGGVLKGYVSKPNTQSESEYACFFLNESRWHKQNNPYPKSFAIVTRDSATKAILLRMLGQCVCLHLSGAVKKDRKGRNMMFVNDVGRIHPELDLPGFIP